MSKPIPRSTRRSRARGKNVVVGNVRPTPSYLVVKPVLPPEEIFLSEKEARDRKLVTLSQIAIYYGVSGACVKQWRGTYNFPDFKATLVSDSKGHWSLLFSAAEISTWVTKMRPWYIKKRGA